MINNKSQKTLKINNMMINQNGDINTATTTPPAFDLSDKAESKVRRVQTSMAVLRQKVTESKNDVISMRLKYL